MSPDADLQFQRTKWAQYFDDVHVLLFLAPVHRFDEADEDKPRSRPATREGSKMHQRADVGKRASSCMKDMFELWQSICVNALLRKATMICEFSCGIDRA